VTSPSLDQVTHLLDRLSLLRRNKPLLDGERAVLAAYWQDKPLKEIALQTGHKLNYLETYASYGLRTFVAQAAGGEDAKVTKRRFREFLDDHYEGLQNLLVQESIQKSTALCTDTSKTILGGNPPVIQGFVGRDSELIELSQKLQEKNCVALVGSPGVGKSALVAKLLESSSVQFETVIWKSIFYAPSLDELVLELIQLLNPSDNQMLKNLSNPVKTLLDCLQNRSCLIILDDLENILQGNQFSLNPYGEKYSNYGMLFRRLVEGRYASSFLLLSRKPLTDFVNWACNGRSAYLIQLSGLSKDDATALLEANKVLDPECWDDLIKLHRGNPHGLLTAIERAKKFYRGHIEAFLQDSLIIDSFFIDAYDGLFGNSADIAKQIVICIATQISKGREWVPFSDLRTLWKDITHVSSDQLMEVVEILSWNGLLERKDGKAELMLSLPPMIRKYAKLNSVNTLPSSKAQVGAAPSELLHKS
jgi:GTPase SAR1 family protein